MRITFIILVLGLFCCGCSPKQDPARPSAIDQIVAGQDVTWANGFVLRVAKRDGNSLEGIQITHAIPGELTVIKADKGTVSPGSDRTSVKIDLHDAQVQRGNNKFQNHLMHFQFTQ